MKASRALIGACLLAAAGSLPLHALPLIVGTLIASSQLPASLAGAVGTACMVGQLAAVLLWPWVREKALGYAHAAASLAIIVLGLLGAAHAAGWVVIALWFVVGVASGTLMYLALASAALNADRQSAFALRLAFSLCAAAAVALVMAATRALGMPDALIVALVLGFAVLGVLGLKLYEAETMPAPVRHQPSGAGQAGLQIALLMIALFFVGQVGIWSYSGAMAREHGIDLTTTALAMGMCKLLAAAFLLSPLGERLRRDDVGRCLVPCILVAAMLALSESRTAWALAWAFLAWEIALNTVSVRLLALVAAVDRRGAARWLSAAVLLGTATGPLLYGQLWSKLGATVAVAMSAATVPLVMLWMIRQGKAERLGPPATATARQPE